MGTGIRTACGALAVLVLGAADAGAFNVSHDYYVYATYSDGIPIREDVTLTGQVHTEGDFTKTGGHGNWGHAEFDVDIAAARVTVYTHAHGTQVSTWTFATAHGDVDLASFTDDLVFTVPAGTYPDGVTVSLAGRAAGTITSDFGAGAQAGVRAAFGGDVFQTGILTVGIFETGTIVVDDDFVLARELVAPGETLAVATDFPVQVMLYLQGAIAWAPSASNGTFYEIGDGTVDFRDGLRFTALTVPPGVAWTSGSGVFMGGQSAAPQPGVAAAPAARLLGNAPNPFNPATTVTYELAQPGAVNVRIHDLSGALVRTLVAGEWCEAGVHAATWDGRDASGRPVAAGVYICRLEAAAQADARTMVLLK